MHKILSVSILFLVLFSSNLCAQHISIVQVIDGDTLLIETGKGQKPVSIFGIDAPEIGQPQGKEALEYLEKLLLEEEINFKNMSTYNNNQESYEIHFRSKNGAIRNVGCELINNGLAYYDRELSSKKLLASYIGSENYAVKRNLGVWQKDVNSEATVYPWDFRKGHSIIEEEEKYADALSFMKAERINKAKLKESDSLKFGSYNECLSAFIDHEDDAVEAKMGDDYCSLSISGRYCVSDILKSSNSSSVWEIAIQRCSGN